LKSKKYGKRVPPYRETRNYVKKILSRTGKVESSPKPQRKRYRIVMKRVGDTIVIKNVWED